MTNPTFHCLGSAKTLGEEFDRSFAMPARLPDADVESFVAIRSAGRSFALPVVDVARLERRRAIVRLPVHNPRLLGVAGIQGRLLPVYRLSALLDLDSDSGGSGGDWSWIAVCRAGEALGLAFESLVAYFSTPKSNLLDLGNEHSTRHVHRAVRFAGEVCNLIELSSIQAAVQCTVLAGHGAAKESL